MDTFRKFELKPENLARVTFTARETTIVTNEKTVGFFTEYKKQKKLW
jgi:hypothetical protein